MSKDQDFYYFAFAAAGFIGIGRSIGVKKVARTLASFFKIEGLFASQRSIFSGGWYKGETVYQRWPKSQRLYQKSLLPWRSIPDVAEPAIGLDIALHAPGACWPDLRLSDAQRAATPRYGNEARRRPKRATAE